jgi:hypothetical protein
MTLYTVLYVNIPLGYNNSKTDFATALHWQEKAG